jgi:hypothetical protein
VSVPARLGDNRALPEARGPGEAMKDRDMARAPTSVALECETSDGADSHRHFSINFNVAGLHWTQSEPGSSSDLFTTKRGSYVTVVNTTSLRKDDPNNTVVAILRNFNPSTANRGDSGNDGKALETGRIFKWTAAIVVHDPK